MKKILFAFLLIAINTYSQELTKEITTLTNNKNELLKKIVQINDSIKVIDKEILKLTNVQISKDVSNGSLIAIARKGARLKSTTGAFGEDLSILDEGIKMVVLDVDEDGYLKVRVGTINGFISDVWIQYDQNLIKFIANKKDEIQSLAEKKQKRIDSDRKNKEDLKSKKDEKLAISKYGAKIYNQLKEGYYWIGMNKDMAIISLGNPNYINRTVGSWGVHEQWVYDNNFYIYFENGKLTSYQD